MLEAWSLFCGPNIVALRLQIEKIQRNAIDKRTILRNLSTSFMKCHCISEFVPKIPSPLRFR